MVDAMAATHVRSEELTLPPIVYRRHSRRVEIETVVLLVLTVACAVFANLYPRIGTLPGALSLVGPVVYLFVERKVRHRSWADLGIRWHGFWAAVRSNWWLVLLTVFGTQVVGVVVAKLFWPATLTHISGRIPAFGDLPALIPLILILALREEMVFRGLFQERVGWFFGQVAAVVSVSIGFAFTHITPGAMAVVSVDVFFVFLDGVIYGTIYSRSRNIFVSWAAHAASDFVGLALIMWAASGS